MMVADQTEEISGVVRRATQHKLDVFLGAIKDAKNQYESGKS